jgi:hypothetical protein
MHDRLSRRLKLIRAEAHACLHLARLTHSSGERAILRNKAAHLAMLAEGVERQQIPFRFYLTLAGHEELLSTLPNGPL